MQHFAYIFLLLFTLSYPLFKSFEEKIRFYKKWRYLFPSILVSAAVFIPWDIWFTKINVWSFNSGYVQGLFIYGLPVEEWLFFLVVPFSCIFIYEVLNYFIKKDLPALVTSSITLILATALLIGAIIYHDKIYTLVDFAALSAFLFIHQFIIRSAYLGRFYIAWAVCIVPFLLINGFITGLPIVVYNNLKNMNVRIYCIPLEDLFYGMLQILLVVTVYEYLKRKRA
ncbi:MAG: lycopene cyclase domain protein [Bacteroidetes bacterium]|nr:lycopene cyclase domain protein [Bacteroidota bacterium]